MVAAGTRLGPYEVLAPLGAGGMGEVYRARDTRLGRDVALKVLPEAVARDPDRVLRFEREARALAALSHPGLLAIHDLGREGDLAFAVTELLEGETLRQRSPASGSPGARPSRSPPRSPTGSPAPTTAPSSTATSSPRTSSSPPTAA